MSDAEKLALLASATKNLLELIGDGFHREGGTEATSWDVCIECGDADWAGHKEGCKMQAGITQAKSALALTTGEPQ